MAPPVTNPPGSIQTPHEASDQVEVAIDYSVALSSLSNDQSLTGGIFGWGKGFMSKVMEKTKSSVETMITTLDPGMKQVILSGGDIDLIVTSTKEVKVGAVRDAFQDVFGKAFVTGQESQANTAVQPVGFTAGLKGAEERIDNLCRSGDVDDKQTVVSMEGFIVEILPEQWYELTCLLLKDPVNQITIQTFSQPTPVPLELIQVAHDDTPPDYPLRWSGLAVSIGQAVEKVMPHVNRTEWQEMLVGVSRQETLMLAAKCLAGLYRQRLQRGK